MKKVSFMVAFLAVLQITLGAQVADAQQRLSDRRTVEEALDVAGEDIGKELEELFEQLGITAEKIGEKLERWAEENSEELEAWSEKYGYEWERFGDRLSRKMEGIASDQEDVWNSWARRYEQKLERWSDQLDSDELNAENVGEFVESNLEMLSRMPLGRLVDQVLQDGVGELKSAPWESLDELGRLAQSALEAPLEELGSLSIEGSRTKRAFEKSARELNRSLEQLKGDVGRNFSDRDSEEKRLQKLRQETDRGVPQQDPRLKALIELRNRKGLTAEQKNRIDEMIDGIRAMQRKAQDRGANNWTPAPKSRQKDVDVPRRDQIMEKIKREKKRHQETLDSFNDDLRRSSEESRSIERQKSNQRWKAEDARQPKRADGKKLDANSRQPSNATRDPLQWFRDDDGRQQRRQKQNARPQNRDSKTGKGKESDRVFWKIKEAESKPSDAKNAKPSQSGEWRIELVEESTGSPDELDILRQQIEELRKEIQRLKKDKSEN